MRALSDGSDDPCDNPANVDTDYCQLRRYDMNGNAETPAEWNARTAAALNVTVTRAGTTETLGPTDAPAPASPWPTWLPYGVAGLIALALLYRPRHDRR